MTQSTRPSFLAPISDATLRVILADARARLDVIAARLIDAELFYRQPVVTGNPVPGHWTATRGDYDLDCTVGWGSTEADAIADLIDREDDIRNPITVSVPAHPSNYTLHPEVGEYDDGGMAEERERHP